MLGACEPFGDGLYYLKNVFTDAGTVAQLRNAYRTNTEWDIEYPNRLRARTEHIEPLWQIGTELAPHVSTLAGFDCLEIATVNVFVDLSRFKLSYHYDNDNYKVLLQVYTGDIPIVAGGTYWYIGPDNEKMFNICGTDKEVGLQALPLVETPYAPGAGYINDNTQRKAHGTKEVRPGTVRESVLFTFN